MTGAGAVPTAVAVADRDENGVFSSVLGPADAFIRAYLAAKARRALSRRGDESRMRHGGHGVPPANVGPAGLVARSVRKPFGNIPAAPP
ncbi:hypothetical protein BCD48_42575 [Pseudofrankia sp. BMG5.36]|nr:hypothetical protein BCD48_42575 [Pseudofrankia sp. BMG5.36]